MFAEDLRVYFNTAEHAELVTVQGVQAAAIFNTAAELVAGDAIVQAPVLELPATVAAAEGGACVVRGSNYRIRQVRPLEPDGAIQQLVLVKV